MNIIYRRMSGAIGLSDEEKGARGLWWEKRKAFFNFLTLRGHNIQIFNRFTAASSGFVNINYAEALQGDMLFVEFGSSNKNFYGDDLNQTRKLCNEFKGRKVYLCDDPDLPMMWGEIRPEGWSIWQNSVNQLPVRKIPWRIPIWDMPFSSLQDFAEAGPEYNKYFVYLGRPDGRSRMVQYLIANGAPWQVFGKQKEWTEYGVFVHEPPNQPERAQFYHRSLGSLVLADKKHKELGWRTGRAYHAILAGCPAVVEQDHPALRSFATFKDVGRLLYYKNNWSDPEARAAEVKRQVQNIWSEKPIAEKTAKAFEL